MRAQQVCVPTAGSLTPCSPRSRRRLETGELVASALRRRALTAAALGVLAPAQVGTEKRALGRTKKLTRGRLPPGFERDHVLA
jgi:hypothetical protein